MKQNLQSYHDLIENLTSRFDDLNHAYGQRTTLQEESEKHRSQRDKVLAEAVAETDEENIDRLAKHSARVEVFTAKLQRLNAEIEKSEEELQLFLNAEFLGPFRGLHSALLRYRLERAKAQIAKVIDPQRAPLLDGQIEQLSRHSREYVEGEALAIFASDGVATPLHETFPGSPWGQPEQRRATLRIVMNAVQGAIEKGKQLLAAVETEKGFVAPEIALQSAAPAVVDVSEPQLVEA